MKNFLQRIIRLTGFEVHRTNSRHVFWDDDSTFTTLFKSVQHRTAIKEDRAFMLYQFARYARTIPGGAAQLGVWKGGSSKIIAQALTGTDKDLILFDTFEGLPVKENSFSDGRTEFRDTSLEDVQSFLKGERVTFARGFFPDTALPYESSRFSFVYLDADLEESTQAGLTFFYPRLSAGGVIVCDDYGSHYWPGVKKSIDAFAQKEGISIIRTTGNQCVLIKV